ncbi:MAG: hypothetical protein FD139_3651 [Methylocystaceae bacterium]|nr:MAG: hypothetical protein FD139_3651 [Methylocystaceae bacterium]
MLESIWDRAAIEPRLSHELTDISAFVHRARERGQKPLALNVGSRFW